MSVQPLHTQGCPSCCSIMYPFQVISGRGDDAGDFGHYKLWLLFQQAMGYTTTAELPHKLRSLASNICVCCHHWSQLFKRVKSPVWLGAWVRCGTFLVVHHGKAQKLSQPDHEHNEINPAVRRGCEIGKSSRHT